MALVARRSRSARDRDVWPRRPALEELRDLGARPATAIVARRLRALGVRGVPRGPRPSTQENPAGLTTRELEVLALVAEGLRKLDAPTRGQAAAAALRLGLLQTSRESGFAAQAGAPMTNVMGDFGRTPLTLAPRAP